MNKTDEKLRGDSVKHLYYEIWMLHETAQRLLNTVPVHHDRVVKNALVESCLVHARSLTMFLYPGGDVPVRSTDITAEDYVLDGPRWTEARREIPEILLTVIRRTGQEIAHLTTERLEYGDPRKEWPLVQIVDAIRVPLKLFAGHASPARLDADVARFIIGLQPPMATPDVRVYDSTSTGLSTVSGPAQVLKDMRTE